MKVSNMITIALLMFIANTLFAKKVTVNSPLNRIAQFKGGEEALAHFLARYIDYSDCAKENGLEGEVIVSFEVLPNGAINDPTILKKLNGPSNQIAMQAISAMPNWIPALKEGKPIKSKHYLTIQFYKKG